MGLYSEGFIFRVKIKLDIWAIFEFFLWCFTALVAYPFYRFAPILLTFKPLPSKNSDAHLESKTESYFGYHTYQLQ